MQVLPSWAAELILRSAIDAERRVAEPVTERGRLLRTLDSGDGFEPRALYRESSEPPRVGDAILLIVVPSLGSRYYYMWRFDDCDDAEVTGPERVAPQIEFVVRRSGPCIVNMESRFYSNGALDSRERLVINVAAESNSG